MNEKLNNIFVTVDVAKLAKEKGFDEWCSAFSKNQTLKEYENEISYFPNICDSLIGFGFENYGNKNFISMPTHFQLIKWLKDKHDIDAIILESGLFKVINQYGNRCYNDNDDSEFEINEALTIALNQIL